MHLKNKNIIKISVLFLIVLALSVVVNSQGDFGCCCNPVTQSGYLASETDCENLNYDFIGMPPAGVSCEDFCEAEYITIREPICGDKICEGDEQLTCLSDCITPELRVCGTPGYKPAVRDVVVTPITNQKAFRIEFAQVCPSVFFKIRRAETGSNVWTFVAQTSDNSFVDNAPDLEFSMDYTYEVLAYYVDGESEKTYGYGNLGDIECWNNPAQEFCLNENFYYKFENYFKDFGYETEIKQRSWSDFMTAFDFSVEFLFSSRFNNAYSCDAENNLVFKKSCPGGVCGIKNSAAVCIQAGVCENFGPFDMFSDAYSCERTVQDEPKFCFFDVSNSIVDTCYDCSNSMDCYDYKSKDSCLVDNCGLGSCEWHSIFSDVGIGVCVNTQKTNCDFCDLSGSENSPTKDIFNVVLNNCSEAKAVALSVPGFQCLYHRDERVVKSCDVISCRDYSVNQCGSLQPITLAADNEIIIKSVDPCNIGVCQLDLDNVCKKNADGNTGAEWPDCSENIESCELDYFPPMTSLIPGGVQQVDFLTVVVLDKQTKLGDLKDHADESGYETFLCLKSGQNCLNAKTYPMKVTADKLILKNLDLKDGQNKLTTLNKGLNTLFFYSKDPSSNLEIIKSVTFTACDACQGPTLLDVQITGGKLVGSNLYSSVVNPVIALIFDERAKITDIELSGTPAAVIYDSGFDLNQVLKFDQSLAKDVVFRLTVEVVNEKDIKSTLYFNLIIDSALAIVEIIPEDGEVLASENVNVELKFSNFVDLSKVLLTHITVENEYSLNEDISDITEEFSSVNNMDFLAALTELEFGAYSLYVEAENINTLPVAAESRFFVKGIDKFINLVEPKFGVSSRQVFNVVVKTALKYDECRYVFNAPSMPGDSGFSSFLRMEKIGSYSFKTQEISIPLGDNDKHPLYVYCKRGASIDSQIFEVAADPYAPEFVNVYAFPEVIAEEYFGTSGQYATNIKVETDKDSFCKFSDSAQDYASMEYEFDGFGITPNTVHSKAIIVDQIKSYTYYVACESPAGVVSEVAEVSFSVDLDQPLEIKLSTKSIFSELEFPVGVEVNKRSFCYIGDEEVCMGSCSAEYVHKQDVVETSEGIYEFTIKCVPLKGESDSIDVEIIIDQTPPEMLWVNDSSALEVDNVSVSYFTDKLRVSYLGNDSLSGIAEYRIYVVDSDTDEIIQLIPSYVFDGKYHYIENLSLVNDKNYHVVVEAVDNAGLVSLPLSSKGVLIDTSAKPYTCNNNVKDGSETDVDCGGSCLGCSLDMVCAVDTDCNSGLCLDEVCIADTATCNNGVKDGRETDVDCGGACPSCSNGKDCYIDSDCSSDYCDASSGECRDKRSCFDGKLSSGETDVDCGGPCMPCEEGKSCEMAADCKSGFMCEDNVCVSEDVLDSDNDNVLDKYDMCPDTPLGEEVDEYGCSLSQRMPDVKEEKFNFLLFFFILLLIIGAGFGGYLLYKKFKKPGLSLKKLREERSKVYPKPRPAEVHVKKPVIEDKFGKLKKFAKKRDLEKGWVELKPKKNSHKAIEKLRSGQGRNNHKNNLNKLRKKSSHKSKAELFEKLKKTAGQKKKR